MTKPTQGPSWGYLKVNFSDTLSIFGDKCPQNGSKNEQTAPRTNTGYPHIGPFVVPAPNEQVFLGRERRKGAVRCPNLLTDKTPAPTKGLFLEISRAPTSDQDTLGGLRFLFWGHFCREQVTSHNQVFCEPIKTGHEPQTQYFFPQCHCWILEILYCNPKGCRALLRIPSTEGRSVCLCWEHSKPKGPKGPLKLPVGPA